jgi:hypothetical protein
MAQRAARSVERVFHLRG